MDGFFSKTNHEKENLNQGSKNFDPKISDLCLADSFLDFDNLREFFEDSSAKTDRISLESIGFAVAEKCGNMAEEGKPHFGEKLPTESEPISNRSGVVEGGLDSVPKEVDALKSEKENSLDCCIEDEMGKVSLVSIKSETGSEDIKNGQDVPVNSLVSVPVVESNVRAEVVTEENKNVCDSESESESSTSSSSSSSSSSSRDDDDDEDDDDEEDEEDENEKNKKHVKMEEKRKSALEEGEIEGVDGTNDEDEDEDEDEDDVIFAGSDVELGDIGAGAAKGPIRSKNEVQVLPPVPEVKATLEPHHQMHPIGTVLSVMGAQVIVEGAKKHNPLNEGSILWITESRSPLGLIDEIFGPVKNPYYIVRYNSETEIPDGIQAGTPVSFVEDFASHVLNDKNLYRKGYDASGENDEELTDEAEFSDDEKEAEYRRKLKMEKRGMSDHRPGSKKNKNRKKVNNRDGLWRNDGHSKDSQKQNQVPPVPASSNRNSFPSSSTLVQGFAPVLPVQQAPGFVPSPDGVWSRMPAQQQLSGFTPSPDGVWSRMPAPQQLSGFAPSPDGVWPRMPAQQQLSAFPNAFTANGMPWPTQNYQQLNPPYQMPIMNNMPFQQQLDTSQQPNFFGGPTYRSPMPMLMGQTGFDPSMGMGLMGPPTNQSVNLGPNGLNQAFGMAFPGQPGNPAVNAPQPFPGQPGNPAVNAPQPFPGQPGNPAVNAPQPFPGQPGSPAVNAPQNFNFRLPVSGDDSEDSRQFNMGMPGRHGRRPYHNNRGGGRRGGGRFGGGMGRRQFR